MDLAYTSSIRLFERFFQVEFDVSRSGIFFDFLDALRHSSIRIEIQTGEQVLSSFTSTFPRKHTFLAVVHVEGNQQALRNSLSAREEGADGIFLINHSIPYNNLLECYALVREQLPNFWVGLNCLDLGRSAVNYIPKQAAGLWVDNAGINESDNPVAEAQEFVKLRKESGWRGIYFGGVAFKYQDKVEDVARVAKLAIPFVEIGRAHV